MRAHVIPRDSITKQNLDENEGLSVKPIQTETVFTVEFSTEFIQARI